MNETLLREVVIHRMLKVVLGLIRTESWQKISNDIVDSLWKLLFLYTIKVIIR